MGCYITPLAVTCCVVKCFVLVLLRQLLTYVCKYAYKEESQRGGRDEEFQSNRTKQQGVGGINFRIDEKHWLLWSVRRTFRHFLFCVRGV